MLSSEQTEPNKFKEILLEINRIIEHDRLSAGDRLPSERELSERLQSGRSSVREALRALELLGIITTRRGEGTFLQHHTSHQLVDVLTFYILRDVKSRQDLVEMRGLMEVNAAHLSAKRMTTADADRLQHTLVKMEQKIRAGELPSQEDHDFHHQIVRASGNTLLLRMWYPIVLYSREVRESSLNRPGRPLEALEEHRVILQALQSGDPDQAANAMRLHLEHGDYFRE